MPLIPQDHRDYIFSPPAEPWHARQSAPAKQSVVATTTGILAGLIFGIVADTNDMVSLLIGGVLGAVGMDTYWRYIRHVFVRQ
ncbi:MAG: hypothetical protein WAP35_01940 [Solirubrobacterales bacterium]